jgi:hypothetical protein
VAARLPLASVPLGVIKAQDYETRDDLVVDAALNELVPVAARRPVVVKTSDRKLRLEGVGYGLADGDVVALVGPQWAGFVVEKVTESPGGDATTVEVDRPVGQAMNVAKLRPPPQLLAHPAVTLRPFPASADPALYPPAAVKAATNVKPTSGPFPRYWYSVQRADGDGYHADNVYLEGDAGKPLAGEFLLRSAGEDFAVLEVMEEHEAGVTLNREDQVQFTIQTVTLTRSGDKYTSSLTPVTITQIVTGHVSGTVTAIRAVDDDGVVAQRPPQPLPASWLTDWAVTAPLASVEPNPGFVPQ